MGFLISIPVIASQGSMISFPHPVAVPENPLWVWGGDNNMMSDSLTLFFLEIIMFIVLLHGTLLEV